MEDRVKLLEEYVAALQHKLDEPIESVGKPLSKERLIYHFETTRKLLHEFYWPRAWDVVQRDDIPVLRIEDPSGNFANVLIGAGIPRSQLQIIHSPPAKCCLVL